jgi:O-antigen/teichoic acid export membrane protein
MRLGQTSVIDFAARLSASIIGFFATVYIARQIGSAPLGIYQLSIGLVSWLSIGGKIGLSGAVSKRVSEGDEQAEYAVAGTLLIGTLFVVVAVVVLFFRTQINEYVGYPATLVIILILFLSLVWGILGSLLAGLHLVHIDAVLSTVQTGSRNLFQIGAVFASLGVAGLFWGHIAGTAVVVAIGLYVIPRKLPSLAVPQKRHFRSLFEFAKFSWLGSLQARMFNYTDIIVLGFFVSSSLIGIYSVAWNIAQVLILFSGAVTSALFPEISELSAKRNPQAAAGIIEQSLIYGGLFLIPGVFGGGLLGERILRIYGSEFTQGTTVLFILIIANLFMGYQNQLLNALNAIDRPDLSFRVNAVFVVINVVANGVLIYLYGWLGAAVATAVSVAVSLVLAYHYLSGIITFVLPIHEMGRQIAAALMMSIVVYTGLLVENTYQLVGHNIAMVLVLVVLGAGIYFTVLLVLSTQFRTTIRENIPMFKPYLSW